MLKNVIEDINNRIAELGVFDTIHDLCDLIHENQIDTNSGEVLDNEMVFPAYYTSNSQYTNVAIDSNKSVCYPRRAGQVNIDESDDYDIGCDVQLTVTYPVRYVGIIYKCDKQDAYRNEKQVMNIIHAISQFDNRKLCAELSVDSVRVKTNAYNTDRYEVINQEFQNVDFDVPFDCVVFALDIDIIIISSKDCWINYERTC